MGGLIGALETIGCLIIFLILLKIGWKVSTCVRMTPVKSFLNQTTHSKVMIKNPNAQFLRDRNRNLLNCSGVRPKSAIKKHLSLSAVVCDRKHANRIPRPREDDRVIV